MASGKRILGTVLFFIALAVLLAFGLLLYAKSVNDSNFPLVDEVSKAFILGMLIMAVIALLLAILLIVTGYDRRSAQAEDAEAFFVPDADRDALDKARRDAYEEAMSGGTGFLLGADVVVYNLARVPLMGRAWTRYERRANCFPYYFPRRVDPAVYTNDYVTIDRKGTRLKLMTLLAGPEGADQKEMEPEHKIKPRVPAATPAPLPAYPAAPPPDLATPLVAVAGGGSDAFLQELEAKLGATAAKSAPPEVYYDYTGDIHQVQDVEGIGAVYAGKLRDIGIQTTARLCFEDAGRVADRLGIARTTVETWQCMSELMKVKGIGPQYAEAMARAGVKGVADLKKRSATAIAEQVNGYLGGLEVNVVGQKVTAKRVEGWQDAAKGMRRIRLQVPEN